MGKEQRKKLYMYATKGVPCCRSAFRKKNFSLFVIMWVNLEDTTISKKWKYKEKQILHHLNNAGSKQIQRKGYQSGASQEYAKNDMW